MRGADGDFVLPVDKPEGPTSHDVVAAARRGLTGRKVEVVLTGGVVAHKCGQNPEVFGDIMLASRTKRRCDAIATSVKALTGREIATAAVDADDVAQTVAHQVQPDAAFRDRAGVRVLHPQDHPLARLRRRENADKKVGIVLFGFPPNAGAVGTAAYLSVFESLFNTLTEMKAQGYAVEIPESVDALRAPPNRAGLG